MNQSLKYPCNQCGAFLVFNPGRASLTCDYCEHENHIPQSEEEVEELDFHTHIMRLEDREETEEQPMVTCDACGAETAFDSSISSDNCPYCDAHLSTGYHNSRQIRPRSLLPFKVDKKDADRLHREWIKSLWFAPNKLKAGARLHGMHGIYMPYWTYDTFTITWYRGERGDHYTETEEYEVKDADGKTVKKTRRVRKTRWTRISGTVYNNFDDILIPASQSLPYDLLEKLEPWDLHELLPWNPDYLTGFRTESYQLGVEDGFDKAKDEMYSPIINSIEDDIGGDRQRIHHRNTDYRNLTFKHILLPVWISPYRFNSKVYRTVINARTGEVQGERPYSWIKITLAILALMAVITVIIYKTQQ